LVRRSPAVDDLAGVRDHLVRDGEAGMGIEAHDLFGGRDFLDSERAPVGFPSVLQVRRREADNAAHPDEAGAVGLGLRSRKGFAQRVHVLGVGDVLDVPAVCGVARRDVLAERDVGVALDGDVVVVIEHDEVSQPLVTGEAAGFGRDTFFHVSVGHDHPDGVVEDALAGLGVRVIEPSLAPRGHRHAHGGADARAERAGGGLDAEGVAVLRVSWCATSPLPVELEVLEGQPVAGQVELDVEGQAGMPAGKNEAVASDPVGVGRIVAQEFLEDQIRGWGEAHRRAGVAVAGRLNGVHGERPNVVDGLPVEV
jgi:hypothetical protein